MMRNKTNATTLATLIIGLVDAYVLLFSTMPLLYKIVIVAFSFFLLLLATLALQSLETIDKSKVS